KWGPQAIITDLVSSFELPQNRAAQAMASAVKEVYPELYNSVKRSKELTPQQRSRENAFDHAVHRLIEFGMDADRAKEVADGWETNMDSSGREEVRSKDPALARVLDLTLGEPEKEGA